MSNSIYFYLSFGSPYSYIAAQKIEDIARKYKLDVLWRPLRLKNVMSNIYKDQNIFPPSIKMSYMRKDSERTATLFKLPFLRPDGEPPFDCDEAYACVYAFSEGNEVKLRNLSLALVSSVWSKGNSLESIPKIK